MTALEQREAEAAVDELRAFIALYEGVDVPRGSPLARRLEQAKKAVAAFDDAQTQGAHDELVR